MKTISPRIQDLIADVLWSDRNTRLRRLIQILEEGKAWAAIVPEGDQRKEFSVWSGRIRGALDNLSPIDEFFFSTALSEVAEILGTSDCQNFCEMIQAPSIPEMLRRLHKVHRELPAKMIAWAKSELI